MSKPLTNPGHHILVASIPAAGHVFPYVELVRTLVRDRYRITFLIGEAFRKIVEDTGARYLHYDSLVTADALTGEQDDFSLLTLATRDATRMIPTVKAFIDADRPDLVLYDCRAPGAGAYAQHLGIPTIRLHATFACPDSAEPESADLWGVEYAPDDPRLLKLHEVQADLISTLRSIGIDVPPRTRRFSPRTEHAIVFIPTFMQPRKLPVDRSVFHFVGPVLWCDPEEQCSWRPPEGVKKLLLISFGSIMTDHVAFYRTCIEAFGHLDDWHVVLQIGRVDGRELGHIPENFEVHSWIPQVAVLRHADAFITHAGMGGVREALACGVPMIAIPQVIDEFQNADSLIEAGVGVRISLDAATPQRLLDALSTVQTPAVTKQSARIAKEIGATNGIRLCLNIIQSAISSRPE
ncbi:macrolide family glycosyltransferase [Burkholderia ubonensis]|uniref:macrolide family glycosyltransferase n=1 Tax=Burkholderia ubonensis TaxID=101571 RepID=UPI000B0C1A13|nr:macrolide family glycosyltransferase [Burkholderia ubonensis]